MSKSVGIHMGLDYSIIAYKDKSVRIIRTGVNNEDFCKSCVAMDRSGNFVIGNAPYRNWKKYAPNIVVGVMRLLGASFFDPQVQRMKINKNVYPFEITRAEEPHDDSILVKLCDFKFTPEQICSEILKQLKNDASVKLGDEVTHAVITVPSFFNDKQKVATGKAAELAGLKVLCILSESIAAAISYGLDQMTSAEDKFFLVYDLGVRSFDLSILVASSGHIVVAGTGGDKWLGGIDIDNIMAEYVLSEVGRANGGIDVRNIVDNLPERKKYAFLSEFKSQVESAKKALSQSESATVSVYGELETEDGDTIDLDVTITRAAYESMIRPLIQRTLNIVDALLEKTGYPIGSIDNILLVGDSSSIPLVRTMLADKYGSSKILSSEKPMYAIAEGAAILAESKLDEIE